MRFPLSFLQVWLTGLLACQLTLGQLTQGTITGLVTDATGAVVPSVKVVAQNTVLG